MTAKNWGILYAWLNALLSAFWQGMGSAFIVDTGAPFVGVTIPNEPWAKFVALGSLGLMMGVKDVINILKASPLPKLQFDADAHAEQIAQKVSAHVAAMTPAVEPPKEQTNG